MHQDEEVNVQFSNLAVSTGYQSTYCALVYGSPTLALSRS